MVKVTFEVLNNGDTIEVYMPFVPIIGHTVSLTPNLLSGDYGEDPDFLVKDVIYFINGRLEFLFVNVKVEWVDPYA